MLTIRNITPESKYIIQLKNLTKEVTAAGAMVEAGRMVIEDMPVLKAQLSKAIAERNMLYNNLVELINNYKTSVKAENRMHEIISYLSKEINLL